MADLTTTSQFLIGYRRRQRPGRAGAGVSAALLTLSDAMARAFAMAYVLPYGTTRRQSSDAVDTDADGRDSRW